MKAIQATGYGAARENLQVVDIEPPNAPGPGEVLVDIEYAPLNKHDLLAIAGLLYRRPLPYVPGHEGAGVVAAVGSGVTNVGVGDRVVLPLLRGSWQERIVLPADGLFPVPGTDAEQIAMLGSNPPTAALMLQEFTDVPAGSYVVQNAANSGVGRSVIAIAHARGIRTVNFARNEATHAELLAAGADIVLPDKPDSAAAARELIGDARVPLAIDAIGGQSTVTLTDVVSDGGFLLTYANESGEPLAVPYFALNSKHLTVRGFFAGEWDFVTKAAPAIREAAELVAAGKLTVPVAGVFAFDDITAALDQLDRGGKVLLTPHRR